MASAPALIPVAPFWIVKLGASGKTYGPCTEKEAERAAATYGLPTSNFVTRVLPLDELSDAAGNPAATGEQR